MKKIPIAGGANQLVKKYPSVVQTKKSGIIAGRFIRYAPATRMLQNTPEIIVAVAFESAPARHPSSAESAIKIQREISTIIPALFSVNDSAGQIHGQAIQDDVKTGSNERKLCHRRNICRQT